MYRGITPSRSQRGYCPHCSNRAPSLIGRNCVGWVCGHVVGVVWYNCVHVGWGDVVGVVGIVMCERGLLIIIINYYSIVGVEAAGKAWRSVAKRDESLSNKRQGGATGGASNAFTQAREVCCVSVVIGRD